MPKGGELKPYIKFSFPLVYMALKMNFNIIYCLKLSQRNWATVIPVELAQ